MELLLCEKPRDSYEFSTLSYGGSSSLSCCSVVCVRVRNGGGAKRVRRDSDGNEKYRKDNSYSLIYAFYKGNVTIYKFVLMRPAGFCFDSGGDSRLFLLALFPCFIIGN